MWLLHMQVQIDTLIFLWDAITNMKAIIIMVLGLHELKVGEKAILDGYVDVEIIDVSIPSIIIPFVDITKGITF